MRTLAISNADAAVGAASASPPYSTPGGPHSAWRSPVPYLFGGLAAMLGLIALALLILACSYWKVSSYLESEDGAAGHEKSGYNDGAGKEPDFLEERILVIMPGESAPTALAIPIGSRATSGSNADKNPDRDKTPLEIVITFPEGDRADRSSQSDQYLAVLP